MYKFLLLVHFLKPYIVGKLQSNGDTLTEVGLQLKDYLNIYT